MTTKIDLQQLRFFFHLAQAGSYTHAARRIYRTQSAVSHAIRKLEESVNVQLVQRRGRGIELTQAGKHLYSACQKIFYTLDLAVDEMSGGLGEAAGTLKIGSTVEIGCSILMKHMEAFISQHPSIDLQFFLDHDLIDPLLRDELDLVIDCHMHQRPELVRTQLFREQYTVVCSRQYKKRMRINQIEDLSRCTLLTMDTEGAWWHHFILSLKAQQRPDLSKCKYIPVNIIRAMIVAAENHVGVALLPSYSVISSIEAGSLVKLFPNIQLLEDRFAIYQKKEKAKLARQRLLTDYLKGIEPHELIF